MFIIFCPPPCLCIICACFNATEHAHYPNNSTQKTEEKKKKTLYIDTNIIQKPLEKKKAFSNRKTVNFRTG